MKLIRVASIALAVYLVSSALRLSMNTFRLRQNGAYNFAHLLAGHFVGYRR